VALSFFAYLLENTKNALKELTLAGIDELHSSDLRFTA